MSEASKPKATKRKPTKLEALIWPIVLLSLGLYRLYGTHTIGAFYVSIAFVVVGLLGLIIVALFRSEGLADPHTAAAQIANQQRQLFGGLHTYRDATDADFNGLDRAFYEVAARDFNAAGFRTIRDIVNVTASNSWPKNHAILCTFLGDGGTTMAAAYHVRLFGVIRLMQWFGLMPRRLKVVECETELTDGTFVATANNIESEKTLGYPFIDRLQFTAQTPVADIVREHRAHVKRVLASKPGVDAMRCRSYGDLRASQDRMHLLKCAYRSSPEFDHLAEWKKVTGRPLREAELDLLEEVKEQAQGES